jgi:uncharacterized protein YdeI (YjbR/CyaY-like superfamily)
VEPTFFETPEQFRTWLEQNHESAPELLVGFHKRGSGRPSITWPESVDQALCFGWIDGVRRSLGEHSYTIRFTPRRPSSIWSARNVARVEALTAEGLMRPAGLAAYERRSAERTAVYSFDRREQAGFTPEQARRFRANAEAWKFFESQAPWYRRTSTHWVVSAKREQTRERRLAQLIADSEAGRRIRQLIPPGKR